MAKKTPATPVALAFAFGNTLPPLNAGSISVKILTKRNGAGKVINANLQINYKIDTDYLSFPKKISPPGQKDGYDLPLDKVGFTSDKELFNAEFPGACSVSFEGDNAYLTTKFFLQDIKRYVLNEL